MGSVRERIDSELGHETCRGKRGGLGAEVYQYCTEENVGNELTDVWFVFYELYV